MNNSSVFPPLNDVYQSLAVNTERHKKLLPLVEAMLNASPEQFKSGEMDAILKEFDDLTASMIATSKENLQRLGSIHTCFAAILESRPVIGSSVE